MSKVYLAYDERMTLHRPLQELPMSSAEGQDVASTNSDAEHSAEQETDHFEGTMEIPHRIRAIYEKLIELEARDGYRRFIDVPCTPASRATIELAHSEEHFEYMQDTMTMSDEELRSITNPDDLYFCKNTFLAARLAVGGVVGCVDAVLDETRRKSCRAAAIVRPPGHHATRDKAMGFCYFNNVAVAAKHALYGNGSAQVNRVFILDWDIHHGNGIQDLTFDDPNIFYLSIHRASFGKNIEKWFYPGTGRPSETGMGDAQGTNLNIAFGEGGMGDAEYASAFSQVVLPLIYNWKPDLILVACGLDAVKGDLLGDCGLSPSMYYSMTRSIIEAAPTTPLVVALEGGYNVSQSADCMEKVALALLDESLNYQDGQQYTSWSCKSILPQRHQVVQTKETQKIQRLACACDVAPMTKANRVAAKAIKRSASALERKGGTCLCGCHFMCRHAGCLPMKKRKCLCIPENNIEMIKEESDDEEENGEKLQTQPDVAFETMESAVDSDGAGNFQEGVMPGTTESFSLLVHAAKTAPQSCRM
ncbi:Histone deacetylase HDA1 [Seminavis robusta]|uniref:histone deacetylase n=1 Tax=Seminavis robusta TaxID=568900 RepID=A0A9N8EJV6_9STRA|nr:Histone deacetylase HDA1 [Seminavis robusta]|eukprot:Sro1119_g243210.1 Histone deacetylase HDA1 (533) ;mRNA; f:20445-22196